MSYCFSVIVLDVCVCLSMSRYVCLSIVLFVWICMAVSYSLVEFFGLLLVFVFSSKDLLSRMVIVWIPCISELEYCF
ncbi:hypothetical protein Hanom_Chr14g01327451 [Helianthus anomalus]